jgi:hypothetical protein
MTLGLRAWKESLSPGNLAFSQEGAIPCPIWDLSKAPKDSRQMQGIKESPFGIPLVHREPAQEYLMIELFSYAARHPLMGTSAT